VCIGGTAITLSGSPAGTTMAWTKDSGTGSGTFGSASAQSTSLTGTTAGSFVAKYTVTNAAGCSDSELQSLTINPKVTVGISGPTNTRTWTGTDACGNTSEVYT
jgi:hypothetical protein